MLRAALLVNGIVDVAAAALLFLSPVLGWRLPGHGLLGPEAAFAACGWACAALALGVSRFWTASVPALRRFAAAVGLLEGALLVAFCFLRLGSGTSMPSQIALALPVGALFAVACSLGLGIERPQRE